MRVTRSQRRTVEARARGCCEYCYSQSTFSMDPFAVEHIIPRSLGGRTELENLAFACAGCNGHKYNRTAGIDAITAQEASLFHPRCQHWSEHFVWDEDCTHIIALSPTGRVTIEMLRLNRPGLINLRRVLYAAGEHPPEEIRE